MSKKIETWTGLKQFPLTCRFFQLQKVTGDGSVDITLYSRDGQVVDSATQVQAVWEHERPAGEPDVTLIEITTAGAVEVQFDATDGKTRSYRSAGSVSLTDRVGVFAEGALVAGNAAANVLAASSSRKMLVLQAQASARCGFFVRCDGTPATRDENSFYVAIGQTYNPPIAPSGAVSVINEDAGGNLSIYGNQVV